MTADMPLLAIDESNFPKKRRREAYDNGIEQLGWQSYAEGLLNSKTNSQGNHHSYASHQQTPRKIVPLPMVKRLRVERPDNPATDAAATSSETRLHRRSLSPTTTRTHQRQSSPYRPLGRVKESQPKSPNPRQNEAPPLSRTTSSSSWPNLLSPCHICHRKPTKKSDLDSYADCQGCGERTCYICMRECLGWNTRGIETGNKDEVLADARDDNGELDTETGSMSTSFYMEDAPRMSPGDEERGKSDYGQYKSESLARLPTWVAEGRGGHRQMVCSRCCVERGPQGEAVCLGCL